MSGDKMRASAPPGRDGTLAVARMRDVHQGDSDGVRAAMATEPGGGPLGWWRRWRLRVAAERAHKARADALYAEVMRLARDPALFKEFAVPDSAMGRFEMVAIHTGLALRRLAAIGPNGAALGQTLSETMTDDMDRSVRELGVGDLSVGKHVKGMAGALLSRLRSLDQGMSGAMPDAIPTMLTRNVFAGTPDAETRAAPLTRRLVALAGELDRVPAATLEEGSFGHAFWAERADRPALAEAAAARGPKPQPVS